MTASALPTRRPVASVSVWQRAKRWVLPIIPFLLVLGAWLLAIAVFNPPISVLPRPLKVFAVPFNEWTDYRTNVGASLVRLILGFVVAATTGVIAGLVAGLSRRVSEFLGPLVTAMNAISGIAWIPLAIAWFGIGTSMVVFIIWNAAFFLIFGNTVLGVRLIPPVLTDGLSTLGASKLQIASQVVVPGAMPYIMSGLRAGLGFGWRAVIAAELVGASSGLGQWIFVQKDFARSDIIVAGALSIGLIGFLMDILILAPLERRTIERWGLVESGQ